MNVTSLTPRQWIQKEASPAIQGMGLPVDVMNRADPFARLHEDVNRLFDSLFSGAGWTFPGGLQSVEATGGLMRPQLDIAETGKAYIVTVEVPGVSLDDLEVTVEEDTLFIRGVKRQMADDENRHVHRIERRFGRFERILTLPADADSEKITANCADGVLTVTIPRTEGVQSSRGRRIPIGNGSGAGA